MRQAAKDLEFELAAVLRDEIRLLRQSAEKAAKKSAVPKPPRNRRR